MTKYRLRAVLLLLGVCTRNVLSDAGLQCGFSTSVSNNYPAHSDTAKEFFSAAGGVEFDSTGNAGYLSSKDCSAALPPLNMLLIFLLGDAGSNGPAAPMATCFPMHHSSSKYFTNYLGFSSAVNPDYDSAKDACTAAIKLFNKLNKDNIDSTIEAYLATSRAGKKFNLTSASYTVKVAQLSNIYQRADDLSARATALESAVAEKADQKYVDGELVKIAEKADLEKVHVDGELAKIAGKADKRYVDDELAKIVPDSTDSGNVDKSYVVGELAKKATTEQVSGMNATITALKAVVTKLEGQQSSRMALVEAVQAKLAIVVAQAAVKMPTHKAEGAAPPRANKKASVKLTCGSDLMLDPPRGKQIVFGPSQKDVTVAIDPVQGDVNIHGTIRTSGCSEGVCEKINELIEIFGSLLEALKE